MMNQGEIDGLIWAYKGHERDLSKERCKAMPSQPQINYLEEQMGKIEKRFQDADMDIGHYL